MLCVACNEQEAVQGNEGYCSGCQEPKSKNYAALASLTEYCQAHPEERFWQALRNWSGYRAMRGRGFDGPAD